MVKLTFDMPEHFAITLGKRGEEKSFVQFNWADMPANAIVAMLEYGAQRTFNDKVGGSDKTLADKIRVTQENVDRYKQGIVRKPRAQTASEEVWVPILRELIRDNLSDAKRKEYKALDAEKRNEWLDAIFDDMSEEMQENYETAAREQHEEREAEKAAKRAKLAKLKGLGSL